MTTQRPIDPPGAIAEDSHWWFQTRTADLLTLLDAQEPARGLVLDVGCGAGNMHHHLSRYGTVIGVDNAIEPLRVAWDRGFTSIPGEGERLPFAAETFDLVALLDVIEHSPDDAAVLHEAYRVTRPGGLVVISSPAFQWLFSHNDVVNHHFRRYSASGLRRLLQQSGFDVRTVTYNNFLVFPAAAGLIMVRKLLGAKTDIASPDDGAYQVEMEPTPEPLNGILAAVGKVEAALLRRTSLPWGTGIIAIAQRPAV